MPRHAFILALFLVGLALPGLAARVVTVDVNEGTFYATHDFDSPWEMNDPVCVVRHGRDIACGRVSGINLDDATVRVTFQKEYVRQKNGVNSVELSFEREEVRIGDIVRSKSGKKPKRSVSKEASTSYVWASSEKLPVMKRETASLAEEDNALIKTKLKTLSHLSMGVNYVFPTLSYSQALNPNLAPGISAIYVDHPVGDGGISALGLLFGINYYEDHPFEGFWVNFAMGAYKITASLGSTSEGTFGLAVVSTIGWRWLWDYRLFDLGRVNFGVGAGFHYIMKGKTPKVNLDFSGLLPSIGLDIGIVF